MSLKKQKAVPCPNKFFEEYMEQNTEIEVIRSTRTIRARCRSVYDLGLKGELSHFNIHPEKIPEVAKFVIEVTKENYPDGKIPYHSRWSHFQVGGEDRINWLRKNAPEGRRDVL
jgi:hypothetical protein